MQPRSRQASLATGNRKAKLVSQSGRDVSTHDAWQARRESRHIARRGSGQSTRSMDDGPSAASGASAYAKSSWTPLNHAPTNQQFSSWSDQQREICLESLLPLLNESQGEFLRRSVVTSQPVTALDFTRTMPRCITLYIFSFLDPRSLCRCARVCWYWKILTEMDELWAHKCIRLSWVLPYEPSEFEQGAWKRFYVMRVGEMRLAAAKKAAEREAAERAALEEERRQARVRKPRPSKPVKQPIWRDPDKKPEELHKLSKKLVASTHKSNSDQLGSLSIDGGVSNFVAAKSGQLASTTNKAMMKSGPIDLAAITQPTLATLHRTALGTPSTLQVTANPFNPSQLRTATYALPKTTSEDRLKAFKRTERHRKAVAKAVEANGKAQNERSDDRNQVSTSTRKVEGDGEASTSGGNNHDLMHEPADSSDLTAEKKTKS